MWSLNNTKSLRSGIMAIAPKTQDRDKYPAPVNREFDVESLREIAKRLRSTSTVVSSGGKVTFVNENAPLEERIPEHFSRLDMYWHSEFGAYLGMMTFLYISGKRYTLWFTDYH